MQRAWEDDSQARCVLTQEKSDVDDLTQDELWLLRAWIQRIGWGKFMRHIGSLMAEQSDKLNPNSEQGKSLFSCSNTLHALDKFFQLCGTFDYRRFKEMLEPQELAILEAHPPGGKQ